jgi:amino acid transporter
MAEQYRSASSPHEKEAGVVAHENDGYSSPDSTDPSKRVIDPESGVKRGLKTRHLSMLALAGIIGEPMRLRRS